jgi:hypothetical protein
MSGGWVVASRASAGSRTTVLTSGFRYRFSACSIALSSSFRSYSSFSSFCSSHAQTVSTPGGPPQGGKVGTDLGPPEERLQLLAPLDFIPDPPYTNRPESRARQDSTRADETSGRAYCMSKELGGWFSSVTSMGTTPCSLAAASFRAVSSLCFTE